jgi:2-methylcitrate dehydratase PrpD
MAFALDYDGSGGIGPLHDLVCSIPTALAISEVRGAVSGKELITAIAVGEDLVIRINNSGKDYGGFLTAGIVNVFGTAAISAKILGLDMDEMLNALGLAFIRGTGSHQVASDKANALRLLAGWSSRSGVEAALLAQRGFTGVKNVLQGFHGFYNLFLRDEPNLNILTDQLGKRFEVSRLQFKYYPSCGTTIAATHAALSLIREFDIIPHKISRITVETAEFTNSISGHPLTFKIGEVPESVEGQFSQPYTVANAILRRSSKLEHFTPKYMMDPEVIELANKVTPIINKSGMEEVSAHVEIEMEDGKTYSKLVNRADLPGRVSMEEVKQKFAECLSFASYPLPKTKTDTIVEMVENLEEVEDISELIKLLSPE